LGRRFFAFVAACLIPGAARAAASPQYDPPRLGGTADLAPRLPAPFVLPDLSHPSLDARLDAFIGSAAPVDERTSVPIGFARAELEGSAFLPRRLYFGVALPYAAASAVDPEVAHGRRNFLGNAEVHIRAVFPMPTSLDAGFVLGVMLPTATFDRGSRENQSAAALAASVAPSDFIQFLPGRYALRPAADIRILRGPLVIQARQGLDFMIDEAGIDRVRAAGRLLAHVGVLVRRDVEVAMEGTQVYFLTSDDSPTTTDPFLERYRISDDRRSAFTVGPSLRVAFADFDVGLAAVTNFSNAFSPSVDGFIAARFSVVAHLR
jgi:hypothetical protein